jgi:hypothetical protein
VSPSQRSAPRAARVGAAVLLRRYIPLDALKTRDEQRRRLDVDRAATTARAPVRAGRKPEALRGAFAPEFLAESAR